MRWNKARVMRDVTPVLPRVQAAYEAGRVKAGDYFAVEEIRRDPYLFAHLLRHWAKLALAREDIEAEDVEVDNLPYSGVSFHYQGYHIKVWKSDNGLTPVPGRSANRQNFVNQEWVQPALLGLDAAREDGWRPNLIILYDLIRDNLHFTLVMPKSGNTTRDSVGEYWREPLPDQITQLRSSGPASGDDDAMSEDVDDFPLLPQDDMEAQASNE